MNLEKHDASAKPQAGTDYKIFTTAHDITTHAADLSDGLDGAELDKCEEALTKYAEQLPEMEAPASQSPVRFLLDLSGSMRGHHIFAMASILQRQGDRLAAAGVPFEILGFTTKSWKGGEPRKEWQAAGRPQNPGRLSDVLHIVFKDMQDDWADCRDLLAHTLRPGLLKENVDGEALQWAMSRDEDTPAALVIISDGYPSCEATKSVNPVGYLDRHLQEVFREMDEKGLVYQRIVLDVGGILEKKHLIEGHDTFVSRSSALVFDPFQAKVNLALSGVIDLAQKEMDAKLETEMTPSL